ncbi:MAG: hypothetical protein GY832_22585 [Chloroflexi bacterium]|nr:hypothetical protein [Chloroflexota bacterium]
MTTVRRWYVYLVNAVSLQAVTWAVIALLRNLLIPQLDPPPSAIAFEISVIIIGLPIFLVHWWWGRRLAARAQEERGATLRRFYLYGTMTVFLGPFMALVYDLLFTLMRIGTPIDNSHRPYNMSHGNTLFYDILALLVLGMLWFYHRQIVTADAKVIPETGGAATARRLYILGFTTVGLFTTFAKVTELLHWIMLQLGSSMFLRGSDRRADFAALITAAPLWLIFWRWEQRVFAENQEERASVLRKFYLYAVVFIGALSVVASSTGILTGILRRVISLPPEGDVRDPLSIIIVMGVVWAYHAFVLRNDVAAGETPRQMGVRRLYLYLIASIGLFALLVGLSGNVSVIIRTLDAGFGNALKEQLTWFTAAIISGLLVWILPWRRVQDTAAKSGLDSADARRSIVRKIYVYAFLFIATMTVLGSAVFVVFRIAGWMLGLDAPTLNELGHAIAFIIIAVGVWVYHGVILRSDHRLSDQDQAQRLAALRVAVVDVGDGQFARAVVDGLKREAPELALEPILLSHAHDDETIAAQLAQAGLIVGAWTIAGGGTTSPAIAQMVADSPARKLLIPTRLQGWEWAGVDRWNTDALVHQTVRAVKQIADGEVVEPAHPMNAGNIIAIGIGAIFVLFVILSLISLGYRNYLMM